MVRLFKQVSYLSKLFSIIAILKINGDELLEATDDGAFMDILKQYFNNLDKPLYPNSENPKAKNLTVCLGIYIYIHKNEKLISYDRNSMNYY